MIARYRVHPVRRLAVGLAAVAVLAASALAAGPSAAAGFSLFPPRPHHDRTIRTRVLPWPGGDRLEVAIDADVSYVQGPVGKVVITGPADRIDDIIVDGGVIRRREMDWGWRWWRWDSPRHVTIVVTAPRLAEAGVAGSGRLALGRIAQNHLDLNVSGSGVLTASGEIRSVDLAVSGSGGARLAQIAAANLDARLSGSGWIVATGSADALHLAISGSGHADMSNLALQDADAALSGSGSVVLAPKRSADLRVAGSGSIRLLSAPTRLTTHRAGSGSIIGPGDG